MHRLTIKIDSPTEQDSTVIWNGTFHSSHKLNIGRNTVPVLIKNWQDINDLRIYFLQNTASITIVDVLYNNMSIADATGQLHRYNLMKINFISQKGQDNDYGTAPGTSIDGPGYLSLKLTYPFNKWFFKKWQEIIEMTYDKV
jgi:hypothetical protein